MSALSPKSNLLQAYIPYNWTYLSLLNVDTRILFGQNIFTNAGNA